MKESVLHFPKATICTCWFSPELTALSLYQIDLEPHSVQYWLKVYGVSMQKMGDRSFHLEKCKSLHFHSHLFVIFACVCLRVDVHKLLLCRNVVYAPAADHLGEHVQVGRGSNGKPMSREDSGSEGRTWGGREEGFESRSTREWITPGDWIDWCLDRSQPWKWLESKPRLWRRSTCVRLTGVCADEPTQSLSQKSHMCLHTNTETQAHHRANLLEMSKIVQEGRANKICSIWKYLFTLQNNERWRFAALLLRYFVNNCLVKGTLCSFGDSNIYEVIIQTQFSSLNKQAVLRQK